MDETVVNKASSIIAKAYKKIRKARSMNDVKKSKKIISQERRTWKLSQEALDKCKKAVEFQEKDLNLTVKEAAKKAGISLATFSKYRKDAGLIAISTPKQTKQLKVKQPKILKQPRVQTIRYLPEIAKDESIELSDNREGKGKSKKQGMVILGDVDFLAEFAKKFQKE